MANSIRSSLIAGLLLFISAGFPATSFGSDLDSGFLTADDWQSIRQQMMVSGTFLSDKDERQLRAGTQLSNQTVLSGTLGFTDYIKPFNTDPGDQFGFRMDLSGNVLVVGAALEDSDGLGPDGNPTNNTIVNSGAVYVFRRTNNGWVQEAFLKASNAGTGDRFGFDVGVDGDLIAVGANDEDGSGTGVNPASNNSASNAGAVYLFERINGEWVETNYLKASNTQANDIFGNAVDVSNRTVVVGAFGEDSGSNGVNVPPDNSASAAGAVYVFVENNGVWEQEAFIKASNSGVQDQFGDVVSISGDLIIAGALMEDSSSPVINGSQGNAGNSTTGDYGAAYIFQRVNGEWSQQAYLKAPNAGAGDHFGSSVSISGNLAVVGARFEDSVSTGVNGELFNNSATNSGSAYVFRRNNAGAWFFHSYLKASNTGSADKFGFDVEISDEFIVVGAHLEDSAELGLTSGDDDLSNAGAAYVYRVLGDDVELVSTLKGSVPGNGDEFGVQVSISGTGVAVAAHLEDSISRQVNGDANNNDAPDAGAVYFYQPVTSFHPISGVVTGLAEGNSVTLVNNNEDILRIDANGEFRFPGLFVEGESFEVLIADNGLPVNPHQNCRVEHGSGVINASTVDRVLVQCTLHTLSINQNINTVNQAVVTVPVQLAPEGFSLSGVEFALDYDSECLDPDVDNDGILDRFSVNVSDEFSRTIAFDPDISDGEISVLISDLSLPLSALPTRDVFSVDFSVNCPDSQNVSLHQSDVRFSASNRPSFSDLAANVVEGTVQDGAVRVWAGITGDCDVSGPGELTVADLGRLVFEIADDDGTDFINAPESDHFGSPQGCDANSDLSINVADLSCLSLLLTNQSCEAVRSNSDALPEVNLSSYIEDDVLWLQARMEQKGNAVSGVSFSVNINPSALQSTAVDFNNDGVPDRLRFNQDLQAPPNAIWRSDTERIDIFLSNALPTPNGVLPLPEGILLEIGIPVFHSQLEHFSLNSKLQPVFSDIGGTEIQGHMSIGDIIFEDYFE